MNRLTFLKEFKNFNSGRKTKAAYLNSTHTVIIDTDIKGNEKEYLVGALVNRLEEYEYADERGLLMHLPCLPGKTVYRVASNEKNPIIPMKVHSFTKYDSGRTFSMVCTDFDDNIFEYSSADIDRKVFLTKSAAKIFLKSLRG